MTHQRDRPLLVVLTPNFNKNKFDPLVFLAYTQKNITRPVSLLASRGYQLCACVCVTVSEAAEGMCNVWMMRECKGGTVWWWSSPCVLSGAKPSVNLHSPMEHMSPLGRQDTAAALTVIPTSAAAARQTVWHKRTLVSYVISVLVVAGTGGLIRQRNDALICRRVKGFLFFSFPSSSSSSPPPPLSVSPYACLIQLLRLYPVSSPLWLSVLRVAAPECPGAVVPPALQWRMSGPDALWLEAPPSHSSLSLSSLSNKQQSSPPARARSLSSTTWPRVWRMRIHVRAKEWMSALWQGSESSSRSTIQQLLPSPSTADRRGRHAPLLIPNSPPPLLAARGWARAHCLTERKRTPHLCVYLFVHSY